MKFRNVFLVALLAFLLPALAAGATTSKAAQITGKYIEARSADVYTGPCFANSEVNLAGQEAVLGWRVDKGTWGDVKLDGLSVVAVVRANSTLGDPYANPLPAKTVMILDERATQGQREALIKFAQALTSADEICHNEETFYQPLAAHLNHAMPAYTAESTYRGNHLDINWSESGRRGSFVGTFTSPL